MLAIPHHKHEGVIKNGLVYIAHRTCIGLRSQLHYNASFSTIFSYLVPIPKFDPIVVPSYIGGFDKIHV